MSGRERRPGYSSLARGAVLLGFGMGATMAPATESIMSSLPLAHAGVGSAMNDTVRMVGGTLGVAILGSLLSGHYGADMEGAVEDLPEPARPQRRARSAARARWPTRIGGDAGRHSQPASRRARTRRR